MGRIRLARPDRTLGAPLALIVGLAIGLSGSPARAQWGYGLGWWGGFAGYQTPASVDSINQRSLAAGRAAMAQRPMPVVEPSRPPRALTFSERLDAETGLNMEEATARRYARAPAPVRAPSPPVASAPAPAAPQPVLPIASFFDRARRLVWPADAPAEGDLGAKRKASDEASLAVLDEVVVRNAASIGTVAVARTKLLDYGRPALTFIRDQSTPRVADTFHLFLMSLYESLGQAAEPPKPSAAGS